MTLGWPRFILIDPSEHRCQSWAASAHALGLAIRTLQTLPTTAMLGQDRVRLVVIRSVDLSEQTMRQARGAFPVARIVAAGPALSPTAVVEAFRAGADDFICNETDPDERAALLQRYLLPDPADEAGAKRGDPADDDGGLAGNSVTMRDLRGFIRRLASSSATVLITGETGTGKDCAAVLLHKLSRRNKGPLVALNCAAIPEALLEGELFGYERGAFSGAHAAYPGKLKLADGGTLFLDEIGELSLAGQAKVLRAIETREAYRLGARTPTRFDVRIVAATNRDLIIEKDAGRFREDLFYRLAVAQLCMPPLRDRPEDIAPIAYHLLQELTDLSGQDVIRIDDAAMHALEAYRWPGNVRELRNALEVAMIGADNRRIRLRDLPAGVTAGGALPPRPADERARLIEVLARTGGNKSLAAQALQCSRMTLYRKLARYGLNDEPDASRNGVTSGSELSPGLSHRL